MLCGFALTLSGTGAGVPALGVSWLGWSGDADFLAAREASYPRCVWVWNMVDVKLAAVLVMVDSVACAAWRPVSHIRAASWGDDNASGVNLGER
jgi:hypothetical protein